MCKNIWLQLGKLKWCGLLSFSAINYMLLKHKVIIYFFLSILVIIESLRGLPPVNEESIIFKEDRQAVGKVGVK